MRLWFAGLFVWLGLLVAMGLAGIVLPDNTPSWLIVTLEPVTFISLCLTALWLFNKPGARPFGGQSQSGYAQELERKGLLVSTSYRARRAFQVAEFEDEGSSYFIELENGAVLYLCGQYLYEYEPTDDDPELKQGRRFPCAEFTIRRRRQKGFIVDILCGGMVIEPQILAPPFSEADFQNDKAPEDGEVISDKTYDQIKFERTRGAEPIVSIVTMAQSTLSIRAATAADAETLTEFARRTFHDAFASMNSPENMKTYMSQNFTPQKISAQLADPRAIFLIAEIEAAPVAFAKLYDGDVPGCVSGYAPVEIERFYVDRLFHGQGVAQTLMQDCFDRAKQLGHGTIYLSVWENNHRAIAFYRKYGFDVVGSHVFHVGDEAQNGLWMERRLQEPSQ
jgi:ribosomal protein S18 acetylase RimI-like enzyme